MSGGPDSLALLLLAQSALPARIEAATVDHGLRPESANEAAMVAEICRSLGVPHEALPIAVPKGNLQDRARTARYAALGEWCAGRDLAALATGHQCDDQAETLVMRLNRGSGLAGLAGVRARGTVPGRALPLVRPLLEWRRTELDAIVAAAGLVPARDRSNEDESFDRVRIRKALAGAGWLDPAALSRSAAYLGEAESYLRTRIDEAWSDRVSAEGKVIRFTPGGSDFEACEIARRIIASFGGTARRSDIAAMVARLRRGENASLGGVLAQVRNGEWQFGLEPPRNA